MLAHPAIAAGLVILAMFVGLIALTALVRDFRKSMESEKEDTLPPPSDFEGW